MSERFLVPLYPGFYAANIASGTFIRITQGFTAKQVQEKENANFRDEYFEIVEETCDLPWGCGLWQVQEDKTLKLLKENYDSSG
jgi:hypothetical protein